MPVPPMDPDEFRRCLETLGWSQAETAERFGVTGRSGQNWALGAAPVPGPVALILRLLMARPELVQVVDQMAPAPERKRGKGKGRT